MVAYQKSIRNCNIIGKRTKNQIISLITDCPKKGKFTLIGKDTLWLIGENLERGDQSRIALELGVSRITVNRTLNGYNRSSRILMALYRTAKANREKQLLYSEPGLMAARLRDVVPDAPSTISGQGMDDIAGTPELPEVRIKTNKRGGQYGNQNARKHKEKEA